MLKHLNLIGIVDVVVVVNGVVVATLVVQLGLDFKLNTKIGLDTTHPPTHHHKLLGHFQAY